MIPQAREGPFQFPVRFTHAGDSSKASLTRCKEQPMKPWRDIPAVEEWKESLARHKGFFSGNKFFKEFEQLTTTIVNYHFCEKTSRLMLPARIEFLKEIRDLADEYLRGKARGPEKLDKPAEKTLERVVWSLRQRADRKAGYLEALIRFYGHESHGCSRLARPQELLHYLENRNPIVDEHTSRLGGEVYLEKLDPAHRPFEFGPGSGGGRLGDPGSAMAFAFREWVDSKSDRPFFLWLEAHPISLSGSKTTSLFPNGNPMAKECQLKDISVVQYDREKMRKEGKIWVLTPYWGFLCCQDMDDIDKAGDDRQRLTYKTLNTAGQGKGNRAHEKGCAFVVDMGGTIYAGLHISGTLHHSSLGGGKKVRCAGMMDARGGKVIMVSANSGHYKPTLQQLRSFVQTLSDHHVLGAAAKVYYWSEAENKMKNADCETFLKTVC